MISYIAMTLDVNGTKTTLWQKAVVDAQIVVTGQILSYVNAQGTTIGLPNVYEMTVINGIEHTMPGVI